MLFLLIFPHLLQILPFLFGPLSFSQVLLGFHLVFDCLADEGIGIGTIDVLDVQIPEVLPVPGRGTVVIWVHEVFLTDCGRVAYPLEVFASGGFEVVVALGEFDHISGVLPVLVGPVRHVPLLVKWVRPVVARPVQFSHQ